MRSLRFLLGLVFVLSLGGAVVYFLYFLHFSARPAVSPPSSSTRQPSFSPVVSSGSQALTKDIPILMYHHIKVKPSNANQIESGLDVSPLNFEEQMAYLSTNGYTTIGLDELFKKPKGKYFVITFDDGYKDVLENAKPILDRFGFRATVFLIVDYIGKTGYLDWSDIEILKRAGWSFGSHTLTHPDLLSLKKSEAERQIKQSKEALESKLQEPINFFSYPAGKFNQEIIEIVQSAGYKGAVTTKFGRENNSRDIYQLKRVRVSGSDTLKSFIVKISGRAL